MNAVKSWAFPPGVPMSVAFALFRQVFASQIEPVAEPHSLMFAVHNDLDVASREGCTQSANISDV